MRLSRPLFALVTLGFSTWCGAAEPAVRSSKADLTPENFAQIRGVVEPQKGEWEHLKVNWHTDFVAARKKAARENKPILLYRTGGAGYNSPLGVC